MVLAIVLILFGAGRIPRTMGDLARGVRAFRTGMRDDGAGEIEDDKLVNVQPADRQPG